MFLFLCSLSEKNFMGLQSSFRTSRRWKFYFKNGEIVRYHSAGISQPKSYFDAPMELPIMLSAAKNHKYLFISYFLRVKNLLFSKQTPKIRVLHALKGVNFTQFSDSCDFCAKSWTKKLLFF